MTLLLRRVSVGLAQTPKFGRRMPSGDISGLGHKALAKVEKLGHKTDKTLNDR